MSEKSDPYLTCSPEVAVSEKSDPYLTCSPEVAVSGGEQPAFGDERGPTLILAVPVHGCLPRPGARTGVTTAHNPAVTGHSAHVTLHLSHGLCHIRRTAFT